MGAILLLVDVYGVRGFYRDLARLGAKAGFVVVVPDIYHTVGHLKDPSRENARARLAKLDTDSVLRDVRELQHVLQRTLAGEPTVMGFCLGGNLALLLAHRHASPTVTFYAFPGGVPGKQDMGIPLEWGHQLHGRALCVWPELDDKVGPGDIAQWCELTREVSSIQNVVVPAAGHGFLEGLVDSSNPGAERAWAMALRFAADRPTQRGRSAAQPSG